jgi:hypothetical protein
MSTSTENFQQKINFGPSFSGSTYKALLNHVPNLSNSINISQLNRGNKKMYRFNLPPYGTLEFTHDYPFLYNKKLYKLETLIKIHPVIKKTAKLISFHDKNCDQNTKLYSVVRHPEQYNEENIFEIEKNLKIIGGIMPQEIWKIQHDKIDNIIKIISSNDDKDEKNKENVHNILEKYTNVIKFLDNGEEYGDVAFFI